MCLCTWTYLIAYSDYFFLEANNGVKEVTYGLRLQEKGLVSALTIKQIFYIYITLTLFYTYTLLHLLIRLVTLFWSI